MSQQSNNKPQRQNNGRKDHRNNRNKKPMSNEKLKQKINKILVKVDKDTKKKEAILKVNKIYGEKLQKLLVKVSNSTDKSDANLVEAFDNIQKGRKDEIRKLKEQAKELRRKRKEQSKIKRNLRKIEKEEKQLKLESSRIEELPKLNNNLTSINLIIDGWNICGCDKIARKSMRGKRGNGAKRIIELMQLFRNSSNYGNNNSINIIIHFDGNGKDLDLKKDNILVKYSGKSEIVDDRLVRELGNNIKNIKEFKLNDNVKPFEINNNINPNRNYIVVTSDRELTLRLNKIGVTCMKSGTFYKKYLKPLAFNDDDNNNNNGNSNNNSNKDKDGDEEMMDKKKKTRGNNNNNNNNNINIDPDVDEDDDDSDSLSSSDSDFEFIN